MHTPSRTARRALSRTLALAGVVLLAGCQSPGTEGMTDAERFPNRPVVAIMESGENAMRAKDYELAKSEFADAVNRDPGYPRARYMLGNAYLALNEPAKAREQMEVALAADVDNEDYYSGLCKALYEDKKLDELFRLLRQRASEHGSVSDYMLLAYYSRRSGDADEAHNAYLTAARLDQGRSLAPQLALADFYDSIGNKPEASRRLRMAYFIDSTNPEVNRRLVAFGHRLGPGLALRPLERP